MNDQIQFCGKCHQDVESVEHQQQCLRAPLPLLEEEYDGPDLLDVFMRQEQEENHHPIQVLYGFTVLVGTGGRAFVVEDLPDGVVAEFNPDLRDVQVACREISDDLLAQRAAAYSDAPEVQASIARSLEAISKMLTAAPDPKEKIREKLAKTQGPTPHPTLPGLEDE